MIIASCSSTIDNSVEESKEEQISNSIEESKSNEESKQTESSKQEQSSAVAADGTANVSIKKHLVGGYEWGPAIDGLVFEFDGNVDAVAKDMFTIKASNRTATVVDAYISDENGAKVTKASKFATVKLEAKYSQFSPFTYSYPYNRWTNVTVTVALASGKSVKVGGQDCSKITLASGRLDANNRYVPSTANLKKGDFTGKDNNNRDRKILWAAYEPAEFKSDSGKNPLVIWLHGQGEGGNDVDIALLGNDVTNIMEDKIQDHFKTDGLKGAYVLALQTPTYWMDNGNGQNHVGNDISCYTATAKGAIDKYIQDNPDVDAKRVYIGGCSNGGYMTMNMILSYPKFFAAAYPVCEAYRDNYIDATKFANLKEEHVWFTTSADDTTVPPNENTTGTYARLCAADAADVHLSYFRSVVGIDNPGQSYMGHWSWIYTLTDRCTKSQAKVSSYTELAGNNDGGGTVDVKVNGQTVTLWGWLAAQKLA